MSDKLKSQIHPGDEIARYITVKVGGVDVTYKTLFIDLIDGVARCQIHDEKGKVIVDESTGFPATVEYSRGVEVEPAPYAPQWVADKLDEMRGGVDIDSAHI